MLRAAEAIHSCPGANMRLLGTRNICKALNTPLQLLYAVNSVRLLIGRERQLHGQRVVLLQLRVNSQLCVKSIAGIVKGNAR